jgi:hypothetical protein
MTVSQSIATKRNGQKPQRWNGCCGRIWMPMKNKRTQAPPGGYEKGEKTEIAAVYRSADRSFIHGLCAGNPADAECQK